MGMSKYDRLLHILNLLRSRRSLNARKLAEECQVTERSIYRDITSLSEIILMRKPVGKTVDSSMSVKRSSFFMPEVL